MNIPSRLRAGRALRYVIALSVWAFVGCSLIVDGDVPAFRCTGTDPSACPSGTACDTTLLRCVAIGTLPDATDEDADTTEEAGTEDVKTDKDAPSGPAALGETCTLDGECKSGLCGSSTILTTAIVPANSKPVCTQTCCTSADCPTDFVCFSGGTGGNYCVAAAKATRTPPPTGGKSGGAACGTSSDCRSGLCSNNKCLDTCCTPGNCASGTECRVKTVTVPAPGHDIWVCQPAESGATKNAGTNCNANGECKTDVCIGIGTRQCRPPCCSRAACVGQGFPDGQCAYGQSGNDYFKFCFLTTSTSAALKGAKCVDDVDCQSHYCDPELRKCAEVCCNDNDCLSSEQCLPSPTGTPFLRCVAKR